METFRAGALYIFESESEKIPFFSITLSNCLQSTILTENPTLQLEKQEDDKLKVQIHIFTQTVMETLRMSRMIELAQNWRVNNIYFQKKIKKNCKK